MTEVALTIAGGAACMTLMGLGAWLVPKLARRSRLLRSVVRRLRSATTLDRIVSWVDAERPDLRRASAPDGTVTLLFSDIENSSHLTERLGDQRWLELLNAHNTIVRAQRDEHRGYEVKSQGDGFMLAFPSARQAVLCATDIQRALARRSANGELPVRVRIGIHTGEAIRQDGDFYGRSVVCAARIADQADGGESWSRLSSASSSGGGATSRSARRASSSSRDWPASRRCSGWSGRRLRATPPASRRVNCREPDR